MKNAADIIEISLQPGDYYFGDRNTRIHTVLGSCVSVTMWHPKRLIGGMCHFMLPKRERGKKGAPDGRYADEAMEMFLRDITAAGTRPAEYEVKLFGGGNMFPNTKKNATEWFCTPSAADNSCSNISCKNEQAGRMLAKQYGFNIQASNLGGAGHRQIFFEIWTGHVWVKHNPIVVADNMRVHS